MFNLLLSADNPFLSFTDDKTVMMLVYLTIALAAAVFIIGILVKRFRKEQFADFSKTAIGIAIGYSVAVVVFMIYLSFSTTELGFANGSAFVPLLFYPILSAIIIIVAGAICFWVVSLFNKKALKPIGIAVAILELGAFIATMVCMTKFYEIISNDPAYAEETYLDFDLVNTTGLITAAVVIMVFLAIVYVIGTKRKEISDTKSIVYGAISVAMSFALSYIRFLKLGQGGSITFASLLPLIVYCCMFGTRRGIIVCVIYGVLQSIQDPFIIHPMQFLLDYPLAFGLIGVSGIFMEKGVFKKNKVAAFIAGAVLAVLLRYACHVCSGIFAFASYADVEKYGSVIAYSFAYNSFALIDMLISIVAGTVLFASRAFTKQMTLVTEAPVNEQDVSQEFDDDDEDNENFFDEKNEAAELDAKENEKADVDNDGVVTKDAD